MLLGCWSYRAESSFHKVAGHMILFSFCFFLREAYEYLICSTIEQVYHNKSISWVEKSIRLKKYKNRRKTKISIFSVMVWGLYAILHLERRWELLLWQEAIDILCFVIITKVVEMLWLLYGDRRERVTNDDKQLLPTLILLWLIGPPTFS